MADTGAKPYYKSTTGTLKCFTIGLGFISMIIGFVAYANRAEINQTVKRIFPQIRNIPEKQRSILRSHPVLSAKKTLMGLDLGLKQNVSCNPIPHPLMEDFFLAFTVLWIVFSIANFIICCYVKFTPLRKILDITFHMVASMTLYISGGFMLMYASFAHDCVHQACDDLRKASVDSKAKPITEKLEEDCVKHMKFAERFIAGYLGLFNATVYLMVAVLMYQRQEPEWPHFKLFEKFRRMGRRANEENSQGSDAAPASPNPDEEGGAGENPVEGSSSKTQPNQK